MKVKKIQLSELSSRIRNEELEDPNTNAKESLGDSKKGESIPDLYDISDERNHIFRWRSSF